MSNKVVNDRKICKMLLQDLMEAVKECQSVYGKTKTLLATEKDIRIMKVCTIWEICLAHGLKTSSVFKNIVSGNLMDQSTFWDFAFRHLTNHEKERFSSLRYVVTDQGKVRALIRAALNERALERYILMWLSDVNGLCTRYESWAFMRDNEATNLLPSIAAGLGSILFAITVDCPDLNTYSVAEYKPGKRSDEIIIAVPTVPQERKDRKLNNSKRTQIISFDEEGGSNSVPSSVTNPPILQTKSLSSSCLKYKETPPSINRINNNRISNSNDSIFDQPSFDSLLSNNERMSNSTKYEEEAFCLKPESPTPIKIISLSKDSDLNISKVTDTSSSDTTTSSSMQPSISLHSSMSSVSQSNSMSVPVDDSAVSVDAMNAERMQDLEEKCAMLESQVAELNVENSRLRTIHHNLILSRQNFKYFSINIPRVLLQRNENAKKKKFYAYEIHIIPVHGEKWTVLRRYSEFHKMHKTLQKDNVAIKALDFPPKKSFGNMNAGFVEQRRQRLQVYLLSVLSLQPEVARCTTRTQLEEIFPFLKTDL